MATIQNPNTSNILVNSWTNLYSNITPVAGFTDKVRIVVEVGSGSIKLSNNSTGVTAVTVGYGNLYDGTARSIAFEGNLTQVNNALLSLQAYNNDPNQLASLKISAVKGGSAYNSVNGHYYEAVYVSGGISWEAAKTAAASRSFNGYTGYLATVTSEEENKFILDKLPADGWIGATDKASEGTWKWDTGPEAGQTLSYTNWNSGEPNNATSHVGSPEGEDYGQFYVSGGTPGKWNDLPGAGAAAGKQSYYVVEYGGLSGQSATEQANISTTLYVQATPVITSNGGATTATINYAENGTGAVTTVTATDADTGDTKTYSIVGGTDADKFNIVANTGVLTFKTSPDYEAPTDSDTNNSYIVTVRVTDSTGLFDEQTLTVNVTNVNEAISFTSATVPLEVADTGVVDTFTAQTGMLSASDIDGDAPIFTIQGGTTASGFSTKTDAYGLLTLNTSTGAYSYTPDAAKVNALAAGTNPVSSFIIELSDGKGSNASQYLKVNLTGANDQPVLQADDNTSAATQASTLVKLPAISEDTSTQGQTVANLLAARVTDPDAASSLGGMLVTANAATASEGTWQYKVSGGSWKDVPAGLTDTNALALAASTSLRFVPAADYHGAPGQLTVYATDNVFAGYTTNGAPVYADISADGVSETSKAVGITVTPVNDAPVITSAAGAATLGETAGDDTSATTNSGSLTGTLNVTDVDGAETLSYSIRGGITSGATVTKDGNYGALTLNTSTHTWTYAVDNWVGFNALPAGASVTEIFTLQVYDEAGATRSQDVVITLQGTNDAPVLAAALSDQNFTGPANFSFQLPATSFSDAEGTNLTYTVQVVNSNGDIVGDGSLPNWLTFNEDARSFSSNSVPIDASGMSIKVTASDGTASVSDIFNLAIGNFGNQAPVLANPVPQQVVSTTNLVNWTYDLPYNTFTDADSDALTYSAWAGGTQLLATGAGLTFDPATLKFISDGSALPNDGLITIKAKDATGSNTEVSTTLQLTLQNDTLGVTAVTTEVLTATWDGEGSKTYVLPANTFAFAEAGTLTFSAKLADDSALPTWLSIDANNGKLSGNPPAGATSLNIVITASENTDATSSATKALTLTITSPNDVPLLSGALPDVTLAKETDFSLVLGNIFSDADGEVASIVYSAQYWNGNDWAPLPATAGDGYWLGFNANSKTFSGNPPANLPSLNIRVTGTDAGPSSSTSTFTLNLTDSNLYAFAANNPGAVTVSGTPTQGQTLTANAPTDSDGVNTATVSYQWQVRSDNGNTWLDVDGARGKASTLTLAQTESGKQLQVLAFYTDKAGVAEIAASTALTIADAEDAGEVTFTAAGLTPDETLTALLSDADGLTNATPTYQWYRSADGNTWNAISGATQAAYTITTADGNNYLRVGVTYIDDQAHTSTAFGVTTSKVTLGAVKPVAVNDTGTVAESGGIDNATPAAEASTGNVLTNDTDANLVSAGGTGDTHTVTSLRTGGIEGVGTEATATDSGATLTVTGSYGTLVLTKATGGYSYTLNQSNAAVEALKSDQSLVESFNYTVTDSTSKADIGVLSLTIEGANDAPVITGTLPTTSTQTEDVAGNVDLSALSISDVDSTEISVQLSVPANNGKLTASAQGGVTVTGSDSATLTITGTTADVSAYLKNSSAIQYLGSANVNGNVTLTVSYKDADSTAFSSLGIVTLSIAAVNDAPVITSDSGAETLSVDYLESRTDAVTTIVANDTADSGTVSYSISGGADADLFQIDVTSGALTFKNSPNFEIPSDSDNNNTYLVTVRATDAGTPTPALFDEQTITVTVTNDTSAADPIEAGGTEPVTINAPVDDATLNITGSSTTTVENPVGDLNIANNGSGTALVTGLKTNTTVNATGTGETSIQEPAGDLSIANSGSGTVTVQGDLAGNKVTIADTGIGKVVINNSGTSAVTVDSVNNGQTIGTSGTGPTTINNPDGNLNVENTGTGTVSVDGLNTGATVTTSGTGPNAITNPDGNLSVINNGTGTTTVANLNDDAVLNVNGTGPTVVSKPDADMQLVNNSTGVVTVDDITSGSVFTSTGTGPATITNPAGNLRINNTGSGTITVEDIKPGSTLTTTGTKPVNLDLSHLTTGQSITVDNDGSGTVNMLNVPAGVVVNTTGSTGPTKITDPAGSFSINNTGVGTVTVEGDLAGDTLTMDGTGVGPVAINNTGTTPVTIASVNNNQTIKTTATGPTTIVDPDANLVVDHSGTGTLSVTGLKQDATLTTTGTSPTSVNDPVGNLGVANNGTGAVTVNGMNADAKLNASGTGPTNISNPEGSLSVGNTGTGVVTVSGDLAGDTVTIDGTGTGPVAINNTGTTAVTIASVNEGQTITTRGTGPTTISSPDGSLSVDNTGTGTVTVDGLVTGKTVTTTGTGATSITNPAGDVGVTNNGTGAVTVKDLNPDETVTASGTGPTNISNPEGSLSVNNTGTGTVTVSGLKADATLNTSGDKPVLVDLSHLTSGQTITIDNDGSGVVNLVNVPEGVIVNTTGSGAGGINYAPTISGVPGTVQGVTVGATASLSDFTVSDKDTSQSLTVTLTATNGTIGGLTDADSTKAGIQLNGTASDINTALVAATFTAAGAGSANVAISVSDGITATTASYGLTASNPSAPDPVPTPAPTQPPVTEAPTPAPTVETIDGTQVESGTVVKPDGSLTESVTVTPVPETRIEDDATANDTLADIPLFWGESTRTQQATTVSLPTGVGLTTEGSRAPVVDRTAESAINELVQLIEDNTTDADTTKVKMLAGGESFLNALSTQSTETLVVNKVSLTVADGFVNTKPAPILITGTSTPVTTSTGTTSAPVEALVIDTRSLPKGSVINLQNVEFAVIVGDGVQVTGGEGANIVFAGAGSQTLILGEGDDELHGGDDNDIVGSKGGNDQLFGDAGDDVLFGGTGNDALTGGTGIDIALFQYALNEYQISQNSDGSWTISHSIEGTDTLKEIEFAEFADQTISLAGSNQWLNVLFQQNISLF